MRIPMWLELVEKMLAARRVVSFDLAAIGEYKGDSQVMQTICKLSILSGIIMMVSGCGGGQTAPKLEPEVAKQRQQAYESKMTDGPPRGGTPKK